MIIGNEVWKNIDYDSRYQVSNFGKIRKKIIKGYHYLKPFRKGNLFLVKIKDKDMNCARLVANAFIQKLTNKDEIDPITLIYSLDVKDERIELAIEEMMEDEIWFMESNCLENT